jgi:hypothetical protein
MTNPDQFWWGWKLVPIIVPILVIVLWVMIHFGLQRWRGEQRRTRVKRATAIATVRRDQTSTIAADDQIGRTAAERPRNPPKRIRHKPVARAGRGSNAGRRPT